ncbi:MAG TPA: hypothetical protein VFE33_11050 [Thermoanaerobaculia bacterium]|nr:hypothetical protein [Thermoanaerobaculia bacterium]
MAETRGRHPDPALLEQFMRDDVTAPEKLRVVRHLLTGCPQCVAVTRKLWALAGGRPFAPLPSPAGYHDVFARAWDAGQRWEEALAAERAAAPALLAGLLGEPREKRLARVRRVPRYGSLALAELLLAESRQRRQDSPDADPIDLAELAVAVVERLDPAACGPTVVRDLLGRAWTRVGDTRRRAGDLPGAERAARSAAALLADAALADRLDLLRLEAAVAADRGRFEEADRLLDRAVLLCRTAGDPGGAGDLEPHLLGSTLIEQGTLHAGQGLYGSAIDLLGEGAERLDGEADPTLLASVLFRRAALLFEVGRGPEARQAAALLPPLYERLADGVGLLRLRWLVGKIDEDEAALREAREGLLALGLGLAAAQASLDLAVVCARKEHWGEIRRLAAEIFPIFRTRDLRRESMAALLVFRRAVETESASLEFLVEVAGYLLGSRRTRWGGL